MTGYDRPKMGGVESENRKYDRSVPFGVIMLYTPKRDGAVIYNKNGSFIGFYHEFYLQNSSSIQSSTTSVNFAV